MTAFLLGELAEDNNGRQAVWEVSGSQNLAPYGGHLNMQVRTP